MKFGKAIYAGGSPNFDERTGRYTKGAKQPGGVTIPENRMPVGGGSGPRFDFGGRLPELQQSLQDFLANKDRQRAVQSIRDSLAGISQPMPDASMRPMPRPVIPQPESNKMGMFPPGGQQAMLDAFARAQQRNMIPKSQPQPQQSQQGVQVGILDALRKMGL